MSHLLSFILICVVVASSDRSFTQSQREQPTERAVHAEMKNVMYHFTPTISVHIMQLNGRLAPIKEIPIFDDKESFILEIDAATIFMTTDSLAHVLNDKVFATQNAPLKDLAVTTEGEQLKIKGKLAKKGNISFEMIGDVLLNSDGRIRLHARHLKAAHLPVKGIMDLFGVEVTDMINTKKVKGVSVDKDDVLLDPEQILPPPQIRGKLSSIKVSNGQIIQVFGKEPARLIVKDARNYMAYRGATLRFGKLTMHDTDLELIDSDPRDPFDFYLDQYKEQLMAGYSKTTVSFGLRTYMVDFNKLPRKGKPKASVQPRQH